MSALVFWHGWGMRAAAWHNIAHHLQGRCELFLPSLPGYDGSTAPHPYTADTVIEAMLEQHHTPITLCGWSLGALLALQAAYRHPEKIKRLILISATPSFIQREGWHHAIAPEMLEAFTASVHHDAPTAIKRFIMQFNHNDPNARSNVRELEISELPPLSVLEGGLALLRDMDLRQVAPLISQPTLLVHGALDPLMPLPAAQWLASNMQNARLALCPHAAHAPFISEPVHCANLIADFVNA